MADKTPESSTVRSALALVGAVDDLLQPGRAGAPVDVDTAVGAAATIIRAARELRPHQVDDVVTYLDDRAEDGAFDPPAGVTIPIPKVELTSDPDLSEQVDRLAEFIIERFPGEPSRSEGAIDTAIRLLHLHYPPEEPGDWVHDGPRRHEPGHDPTNDPDPLVDGHEQRASAAVEELAARVNEADR